VGIAVAEDGGVLELSSSEDCGLAQAIPHKTQEKRRSPATNPDREPTAAMSSLPAGLGRISLFGHWRRRGRKKKIVSSSLSARLGTLDVQRREFLSLLGETVNRCDLLCHRPSFVVDKIDHILRKSKAFSASALQEGQLKTLAPLCRAPGPLLKSAVQELDRKE
jgi:hypothetical protein